MSLADELRARMRLIPVHWEQHKLYARCLTIAEAVEKLPAFMTMWRKFGLSMNFSIRFWRY